MMFNTGDIVRYKASKDGIRPYQAWAGEIKEVKDNAVLVKFDPDYKLMDGLWLHNELIELAPNMKVGFNK